MNYGKKWYECGDRVELFIEFLGTSEDFYPSNNEFSVEAVYKGVECTDKFEKVLFSEVHETVHLDTPDELVAGGRHQAVVRYFVSVPKRFWEISQNNEMESFVQLVGDVGEFIPKFDEDEVSISMGDEELNYNLTKFQCQNATDPLYPLSIGDTTNLVTWNIVCDQFFEFRVPRIPDCLSSNCELQSWCANSRMPIG